jgi:thiosulfate dehydrogenase [quinone] large subunit
MNRQGTALAVLRICIGVFFVFEGLGKIRWFVDSSILSTQLAGWHAALATGSISARYIERIAMPGAVYFARLVPLGELSCGIALVAGIWTPVAALIAFLMALNFQIASGAVFHYSFLSSGYGLPVLGSTLALVFGGRGLPWSVR